MQLAGKTFLVTGAGSGLGAATAEHLASLGANVVLADLNGEAAAAVAGRIGERARPQQTDVADEGSVAAAIAVAQEAFGGLHGAVNCAGTAIAERVLGRDGTPHDLGRFRRVIEVNLVGTFNVTRLVAQAIAAAAPGDSGEAGADDGGTRGVIVNTASVAAFDGQIGQSAYSASKGGVAAMTLPLARELARERVRVVTIAPGIFDTAMLAGLPEPARQSLGQQVPFPPRLGKPAEFAALVAHIIENEMLNGEVIRLDGALRMAPR